MFSQVITVRLLGKWTVNNVQRFPTFFTTCFPFAELWGRNKLSEDLWYQLLSFRNGHEMLFYLMRIQINWSGNSIKSCYKDWIDVPIISMSKDCINPWISVQSTTFIDFIFFVNFIGHQFRLFHNSNIWRWANKEKKQSYCSRSCLKRKMSFRSFTLYLFWCRLNVVRWKFVYSQYLNNM